MTKYQVEVLVLVEAEDEEAAWFRVDRVMSDHVGFGAVELAAAGIDAWTMLDDCVREV